MILVLLKRFLGKSHSHRPDAGLADAPEELVLRIQQGDLRMRNQFITDYQPYVAKVTSRFCRRYIDPARDDEFSIALAAFNEAVSQFAPGTGRSFLSFAETVIRRRLIDYIRKEQRFQQQIPYSSFDVEDGEENVMNPIEVHQAIEQYENQRSIEERRGEIMELNRVLAEFDIRFADLVKTSPKHADSRNALLEIGRVLAADYQMMRLLIGKRMLPIKELLERVQVSRKTLERNRKYIIAVALILNGPFPYLRDYLQYANFEPERSERA